MHNKKGVVYLAVKKPIPKLVTTVSILTRRLKEGKTYNDFRKAWFHTTGFGVEGDDSEEGSNRMYTLINIFDPREVIVLGFATSTLKQLDDALNIDVKVRGENPLDEVIEPEIGRSFCALVAEDDFGAVGYIPYCPPMIDGKETDMQEFEKTRLALLSIFAAASQKRDAVNEARKKK
ncbi:MAG: ROK family protein [Methanoregula sp.]|nr:ROK family protein [Methanoregula sp.]